MVLPSGRRPTAVRISILGETAMGMTLRSDSGPGELSLEAVDGGELIAVTIVVPRLLFGTRTARSTVLVDELFLACLSKVREEQCRRLGNGDIWLTITTETTSHGQNLVFSCGPAQKGFTVPGYVLGQAAQRILAENAGERPYGVTCPEGYDFFADTRSFTHTYRQADFAVTVRVWPHERALLVSSARMLHSQTSQVSGFLLEYEHTTGFTMAARKAKPGEPHVGPLLPAEGWNLVYGKPIIGMYGRGDRLPVASILISDERWADQNGMPLGITLPAWHFPMLRYGRHMGELHEKSAANPGHDPFDDVT